MTLWTLIARKRAKKKDNGHLFLGEKNGKLSDEKAEVTSSDIKLIRSFCTLGLGKKGP